MSSGVRVAVDAMSVAMGCASCHFSFQAQLLFMRRFVRLDGGAAGAELLRLAARVFELGACVSVDEQAGLDSLEAVML